jgi:hypothetical protein
MRRRRFKRRLFWAAVIFGVLLLALAATIAQAVVAAGSAARHVRQRLAATLADGRRSVMPQPSRAMSPALRGGGRD